MNAKNGEEVEFMAPRGKVVYKVLEIL